MATQQREMVTIRKRLVDFLKAYQEEFERISSVSEGTVRNWESGHKSLPNLQQAAKLAQETGVSLDWLVTGEGRRFRRPRVLGRQSVADSVSENLSENEDASIRMKALKIAHVELRRWWAEEHQKAFDLLYAAACKFVDDVEGENLSTAHLDPILRPQLDALLMVANTVQQLLDFWGSQPVSNLLMTAGSMMHNAKTPNADVSQDR